MANKEHLMILKRGVVAWNNWREQNPDVVPDFANANLSRIDLGNIVVKTGKDKMMGFTPFYANLEAADFRAADLALANLRIANLTGANLSGANLLASNLELADLRNANLNGAYLGFVNFSKAQFINTDFSNAIVEETIFAGTDLGGILGVDSIRFNGQSYISIDSFIISEGRISEGFLRGCGVPEDFITFIPSLVAAMQPIQFYSCFISYSHANKSFARRVHDALQGRGIRCWLDEHQLLPGSKIYTEVDRGIRLWDKVLLCCSEASLKSWWVDNEIKIAFDKEQRLWKERNQEVLALIPLNLDDYLFSGGWKSGMATEVKSRLAADFTGWETDNSKFESEFERLVKALRADAGGREHPPQPRL